MKKFHAEFTFLWYDIWVGAFYDRDKKITKRISEKGGGKKSQRSSDPDFAPSASGSHLVMVGTKAGTDNLLVCDFEVKFQKAGTKVDTQAADERKKLKAAMSMEDKEKILESKKKRQE